MKTGNLSRRHFMQTAALVSTGAALAACQPKVVKEVVKETVEVEKVVKETVVVEGTPQVVEKVVKEVVTATAPAPAPKGPVTVTYWTNWGVDWDKCLAAMAKTDEWQEWFPDITVEHKGVGGAQFLTGMASGSPPDAMSHFDYADYFARGVMLPLEDHVANSSKIKLDEIYPAGLAAGQFAGHTYGIPCIEAFSRYGLYMNSKLVADAGLDINKPPETLGDMWDWHQKLTKMDAAGNLQVVGWDPCGNMIGHLQWLDFGAALTMGFKSYDKNTGKYYYDDPRLVEWFDLVTKFYNHLGPDKMTGYRQDFGMWGGDFEKNVMAMRVSGYWESARTHNLAPEVEKTIVCSWMPVADDQRGKKVQSINWHSLCIPLHAKHPEEAFRVKEFLVTSDAALKAIFAEVGWVNGYRKGNIEKYDLSTYVGLDWFGKSISGATYLHEADMNPIAEFCRQTYVSLREQCYRGEIGAKEAAATLQATATKEYENQFGQ